MPDPIDDALTAAFALMGQGSMAQAESALRAIARSGPLPAEKEGRLRYGLGLSLHRQGKAAEAREEFMQAASLFSGSGGAAQALALTAQARAELDCGMGGQSVSTGRRALALLRERMAGDDPRLAPSLFSLALAEYEGRHFTEAEALLRKALSLWSAQRGAESLEASTCLNDLGRICEETGRLAEGISLHRACLAIREKRLGTHPETAFSMGNLGTALASAGQWAEAAEMLTRSLECYARCGRVSGDSIEGLRRNLEICRKALSC